MATKLEKESKKIRSLPLLPLKNVVLFPHLVLPLTVGRPASVAAVEAALAGEEQEIILAAQRDASVESPGQADLYTIGTRAIIRRFSKNEDQIEVFVMGVER